MSKVAASMTDQLKSSCSESVHYYKVCSQDTFFKVIIIRLNGPVLLT